MEMVTPIHNELVFSEQAPPANNSIIAGEESELKDLKEVDISHEEDIIGRDDSEIKQVNREVGRATEVGNKGLDSLMGELRGTDASE